MECGPEQREGRTLLALLPSDTKRERGKVAMFLPCFHRKGKGKDGHAQRRDLTRGPITALWYDLGMLCRVRELWS